MIPNTRSSAPKRFAKFGQETRTFCSIKVEKAVDKLESDRLQYHIIFINMISELKISLAVPFVSLLLHIDTHSLLFKMICLYRSLEFRFSSLIQAYCG